LGAFFAVPPQKTGLSACIFFACGQKGYRFYPLRKKKKKKKKNSVSHQIFHFRKKFSPQPGKTAYSFRAAGTVPPLRLRRPLQGPPRLRSGTGPDLSVAELRGTQHGTPDQETER
jgi:hypothetical protein